MAVYSPEKLVQREINPELFKSAENYARSMRDEVATDPDTYRPLVDKQAISLEEFAGACILHADDLPEADGELALRWVGVAQTALQEVGKHFPELKGQKEARLFGPNRRDLQRQLYYELRLNMTILSEDS